MISKILQKTFYLQEDAIELGKQLLGKFLLTQIDNDPITGGMIIETESYNGIEDKASHAYLGKRTKRNEMMYAQGGVAYVYICYGINALLNVVTNKKDVPHAILIRAIKPTHGIDTMLIRRKMLKIQNNLTNGPGCLTQALKITKELNGLAFDSKILWIEDRGIKISKKDILCTKRIGIDYAEEHALLPWRFLINPNKLNQIKNI
jgi:DNA-3-methyladenine glycosylase